MPGASRHTGRILDDPQHLSQSVVDIVTTPIGSRVMRRTYGSTLAEILDQPLNDVTVMLATGAIAMGLAKWEPRLDLAHARLIATNEKGELTLEIRGTDTQTGQAFELVDLAHV